MKLENIVDHLKKTKDAEEEVCCSKKIQNTIS